MMLKTCSNMTLVYVDGILAEIGQWDAKTGGGIEVCVGKGLDRVDLATHAYCSF